MSAHAASPSSMTPQQQEQAEIQALTSGPAPWPSLFWALGGEPAVIPDVPITAVLMCFYIVGAAWNVTLFLRNKKRNHFFPFSMLMFGFCMARIVTCCLRIAWSTAVHNVKLGIAANIFVAAGVLILYIVNLFFTQRIVRARHPRIGWHRGVFIAFAVFFVLVILCLAMTITVVVQQFYTLSTRTRHIDHDVQIGSSSYFLTVAILPAIINSILLVIPRSPDATTANKRPIDKFGSGRHRYQIALVIAGSLILSLGAAYRLAVLALPPVPITDSLPSYDSRACFYVFNFALEISVVYLYLIGRVDQRFHVPDGAQGPGSYSLNQRNASSPTPIPPSSSEELKEEV